MRLALALILSLVACSSPQKVEPKKSSAERAFEFTAEPVQKAYDSDSGTAFGMKSIYFARGQATLDETAQASLKANAAALRVRSKAQVQIEGHCDHRGSFDLNMKLGDRRATAVRDALAKLGVPKHQLSTISFGNEKPVVPNATTEGELQRNRRANLVLLTQE